MDDLSWEYRNNREVNKKDTSFKRVIRGERNAYFTEEKGVKR